MKILRLCNWESETGCSSLWALTVWLW